MLFKIKLHCKSLQALYDKVRNIGQFKLPSEEKNHILISFEYACSRGSDVTYIIFAGLAC